MGPLRVEVCAFHLGSTGCAYFYKEAAGRRQMQVERIVTLIRFSTLQVAHAALHAPQGGHRAGHWVGDDDD